MTTRTETITKNEAVNLLMNHKLNKLYAGTLSLVDILERCDMLRLDNIPPHYMLHSIHTDYICFECDYMLDELTRCYTKHTLIKKCVIQGFVSIIFIFENDQRVVYIIRE